MLGTSFLLTAPLCPIFLMVQSRLTARGSRKPFTARPATKQQWSGEAS